MATGPTRAALSRPPTAPLRSQEEQICEEIRAWTLTPEQAYMQARAVLSGYCRETGISTEGMAV